MKFKNDAIREQWAQLGFKNLALLDIVNRLHDKAKDELGKEITITCIYRTKEENDALYANTPPDKRPKATPHCVWGAVDIRSTDFTRNEIDGLVNWVNNTFPNPSGKATAIYHMINGNVPHLHLQRPAESQIDA